MGGKNKFTKAVKRIIKFLNKPNYQLIGNWIARLVFGFTFLCVFVPFLPLMPSTDLDPSWKLGLNQVVSQKLNFGTDIIFTFGPYASVYTGMYHPSTNDLMMFGSIMIALFYVIMVLFLSQQNNPIWLFLFSIVLAFAYIVDDVFYVKDVILFSYPLLFSLIIFRISIPSANYYGTRTLKLLQLMIFMVLFSFGILPFIKGTLIIVFVFVFLCALLLWVNNRKLIAVITIVLPAISMLFFWWLAGQKLINLPIYFVNINQIISGYTDAMSLQGAAYDIIIFGISIFFIFIAIFVEKRINSTRKIFLLIIFGIFIFVGYKAGFVRHDIHALIVAETILIAGLFLVLCIKNKLVIPVILLSIVSWFAISINYKGENIISLSTQFPLIYTEAIQGVWLRITDSEKLSQKYEESLFKIRRKTYIINLSGTTDIYSYNQSDLIASENHWSPRPIFQSYAAYNPYLLSANNQHLHGVNAPENILFQLESIDGRFPALDDALSWPTIINYYCVKDSIGPYLHFQKRLTEVSATVITDQNQSTLVESIKLGEPFLLPNHKEPLFAEIEIKPTLFGKILSFTFKNLEIRISLVLENGEKKDYRVIPSMTMTPFIISPLIESTDDFLFLAIHEIGSELKTVKSINIYTPESFYGISGDWLHLLWETSYTIKLSKTNFQNSNNYCP